MTANAIILCAYRHSLCCISDGEIHLRASGLGTIVLVTRHLNLTKCVTLLTNSSGLKIEIKNT